MIMKRKKSSLPVTFARCPGAGESASALFTKQHSIHQPEKRGESPETTVALLTLCWYTAPTTAQRR